MIRSLLTFSVVSLVLVGSSLRAQGPDRDQPPQVSRDHLPPPGMCRIWLDKVPPAQQPAPTDCASAVRNLPRNARVLFNDEKRSPKLPVKSLKPPGDAPKPSPKTGGDRKAPGKPAKPEGEARR